MRLFLWFSNTVLKVQWLVFGIQFYWEFETNLKGLKITNLQFWSSSFGNGWQKWTNQCSQKPNSKPNLLDWSDLRTSDFSLFRGSKNTIQDLSIEDICFPTVLEYYPKPLAYHAAHEFCQILGHSVWKSLKMSHFSIFLIVAYLLNFCPIKIDQSSNTVWPQTSGFQKLPQIDHFWHS